MRHFVILTLLSLYSTSLQAAETPEALADKARAVLARLEREIAVPGLKEPVEVLRDRWGVPHIYAKNQDDLFFAQGFVTAQDRLFQMDLWRRLAVGETAEVLGRRGLEGDRFARLVKYRGSLDAEWASYAADARRITTAFSRGINAYIDHAGDRLPIEFAILGIRPKKWQPEDCLGRMAGIVMTRNFRSEVARAELVAAVGIEKARRIAPVDPVRAYEPAPGLDLAGIDRTVLAGYEAATRPWQFEAGGGSNNWVVDGTLSASGKPLLANDPHRPITLPSLRYLVHLNAPGWSVIGSGEPALPGVAVGHNDRIAWGFTIVGTDQADLYVEEINPDDARLYKVGYRWEKMTIVREPVQVRGEAAPVALELGFTRHGPVLHQDRKRHRAFALKWVGSEPGTAGYLGCLAVDRARNWGDFTDALKAWKSPAENLIYADVDGNIGWMAAGLTPVRRGWDGLLPVPGAAGAHEWQGFLAVKDLPQTYNPANHWIATANHNILPTGYPHEIGYEWASSYRIRRIQQRLAAKKSFDLAEFQSIQQDNTSLPGQALARFVRKTDMRDPEVRPYVELLAGWDGVMGRESRAGPLYAVWLQELLDAFYRPHVPERCLEFVRSREGLEVMLSALEHPEASWFGENPSMGRDRLLRETFARAVKKVRARLGDDPSRWAWGQLHTVTFRHPLATLRPAYATAFNLGPVPRPGDGLTPNATSYNAQFEQISGASYRQIFDLADWDRGLATSTPGQSGQPGSPHYADLLPLWAEGKYFPLLFSRAKVEQSTRHRMVLKPAAKRSEHDPG
jgi:penicillin amidase